VRLLSEVPLDLPPGRGRHRRAGRRGPRRSGLRTTRLTRREALILQFCRQAALDANQITDEHIAALRAEGLGDAEIVEMLEAMSFTTAHTKLVDALAIEPDPWLE
jgi:alkylhydroperoxidase family enzyme